MTQMNNPQQLRNRLMEQGYTWDEAEQQVMDWASDAYDQEQDRKAEEHFKGKTNGD
jgi:hypothetical protein